MSSVHCFWSFDSKLCYQSSDSVYHFDACVLAFIFILFFFVDSCFSISLRSIYPFWCGQVRFFSLFYQWILSIASWSSWSKMLNDSFRWFSVVWKHSRHTTSQFPPEPTHTHTKTRGDDVFFFLSKINDH